MSPRTLFHKIPHSPNQDAHGAHVLMTTCFFVHSVSLAFLFVGVKLARFTWKLWAMRNNPLRRMRQQPRQQLNRIKKIQRGKNLVMVTSTPNSSMWHQGLGISSVVMWATSFTNIYKIVFVETLAYLISPKLSLSRKYFQIITALNPTRIWSGPPLSCRSDFLNIFFCCHVRFYINVSSILICKGPQG